MKLQDRRIDGTVWSQFLPDDVPPRERVQQMPNVTIYIFQI